MSFFNTLISSCVEIIFFILLHREFGRSKEDLPTMNALTYRSVFRQANYYLAAHKLHDHRSEVYH